MYTPVHPRFTIQKWGLMGYSLHGLVFVMGFFLHFFLSALEKCAVVEREVSRIVHKRIQVTNFAEQLMGMSCLQNAC